MDKRDFDQAYEKLMPKQKDVLAHFLQHKSDTEISKLMGIEPSSVRKHFPNIYSIFGFKNEPNQQYSFRDELIDLFCKYRPDLVKPCLCGKDDRIEIESPEGPVPLNSLFYVERVPIEADCYQTILTPGELIRIKAPRQMGKTSLMMRILHDAGQKGYQSVYLNFYSVGRESLSNLDRFLQWFCASITNELNLPDKLDDYWKGVRGSNDKCENYFQKYLLSEITSPLVLGLDNVDQLFSYGETATDFFGLLRSWHEQAKTKDIWKKLRLIIAHSKEVYVPLNINHSPFNVGLPIQLSEVNQAQVQDLVKWHRLDCSGEQVKQMMTMFGGHPYLLRKAFYEIARDRISLEKLLQVAPTEEGPYYDHLRRHLLNLESDTNLVAAMKQVIASPEPIQIGSDEGFKLHSMGLVKFQGNAVMPLCNLYRLYFRERLGVS